MILITDPSPATDTATDILFRSTTDRLASHCRSPVVSGSHLNWKRLPRADAPVRGCGCAKAANSSRSHPADVWLIQQRPTAVPSGDGPSRLPAFAVNRNNVAEG